MKRILLALNIAFILSLLCSYLAAYISPKQLWWTELFALAYPSCLAINLFFILLWLALRKKYFVYSLIAVAIGFSRVFGIFQLRLSEQNASSFNHSSPHPQLKVMSYNVHLFDVYNWSHSAETRAKIFDFLKQESPDIICFQEFFSSDRPYAHFENAESLKSVIAAPYSHTEYTLTLHTFDHWGIATYSKYPIINRQLVHFSEAGGNVFIYTDIVANADTFRVFNVHLESDRFQPADYKFVENLDIGKNEPDPVQGYTKRIASILSRLKNSAIKRSQEAPEMEQYISESPYPVIVCGDFNDVPSSYVYRSLSNNLKDAFRESGSGFGKTYIGSFPSFRIDYILHDKRIESTFYQTGKAKLSDHYPVSCIVQRKD